MRFWKDTSGRYMDRNTVRTLLRDGRTGPLDGFVARSGRTYRAALEVDREAWQVRVRSLGWNEGPAASDELEYEVNPEPVARCPFDEECFVVETPRLFVCERSQKREEEARDSGAPGEAPPKACSFVLPRTVCKREITREEAAVYCRDKRTALLTEFTSRFGRPFSATLVLKENGRHGFEFQPREPRAGREGRSAPSGGRRVGARRAGKAAASEARGEAKPGGVPDGRPLAGRQPASKAPAAAKSAKAKSPRRAGARRKAPVRGDG
jgi:DNA topoisomerase-3